VPVEVDADVRRLPAALESAAYFVVAEALANVAKHSGASRADVRVRALDGRVVVEVADDGRGGARVGAGSGLVGLEDRVRALDGTLRIASPEGGPTILVAELPCAS
jgi:signal transduction histidine kinase